MKKESFLAGLCFISLLRSACAFSIDDEWLFSTAFIARPVGPGKMATGTGFFVFRQVVTNLGKVFLISNKHVLGPQPAESLTTNKEVSATIFITFETNRELAITNFRLPLRDKDGREFWTGHPATNVDVAVIDVTPYVSLAGAMRPGYRVGYIKEDRFATSDSIARTSLTIGDPIVMLGYPLNALEGKSTTPIARGGTIATPPERNFRSEPIFLIDCSTIRGSSGSPVFVPVRPYRVTKKDGKTTLDGVRGELPELLGVVSGLFSDWEIVVRQTTTLGQPPQELFLVDGANLGIVFRADTISEAIDATGAGRFKGAADGN